MQKTALITQLEQTHSRLWRLAQSQLPVPPGIALHGDEWELILGRETLFAWGLCGSSEGVRLVFEMHRLGGGRKLPGRTPWLSPDTHGGRESLSQAGVPGAPGTSGVTSRARAPGTAVPGTAACSGQI